MNGKVKLPVGIQDFEDLRKNDYAYVDKTEYIYELVTSGKPYFLGRPRRFGKSLFLSTLKAYFMGKRELFEGLRIAELEKNWTAYPVMYMDMNVENYSVHDALTSALNINLNLLEAQWGKDPNDKTPSARFIGLIRRAHKLEGKQVVVLIDEYDKPLINTMHKPKEHDKIRDELKGFYGVLKSDDAHLRFVLLTGVTKFSKVSVFSDLNHLIDISLDEKYACICGISESEVAKYFDREIQELAKERGMTVEEALVKLKKTYDGYRFAATGENMYNPFSLLNTFAKRRFAKYWFETGTPTFLVQLIKDGGFEAENLEGDVTIPTDFIADYRAELNDPVPLLYQTGYLTIKSYDEEFDEYVLGFPNEEVKYGFMKELLSVYVPGKNVRTQFGISGFVKELKAGEVDGFMNRLKSFFADIPYELNNKEEKHYQTIFYVFFKLMEQFVQAEYRGAVGRADAVVTLADTVYVFEFKLAGRETAEDALKQIDDRAYAIPYAASGKRVVKIGAEFSAKTRTLSRWLVAE